MLFIGLHLNGSGAMIMLNFSIVESLREHPLGGTSIGMTGRTVYHVSETVGDIMKRIGVVSNLHIYEVGPDSSEAN